MAQADEGDNLLRKPPVQARNLGALGLGILAFAAVAGGPFGIEEAVGVAGPMPVIIGCIIQAFIWSATQCLVAAECATMFPCNGGAITWGVKGLGPHFGFINAMNSLAAATCNIPLYPVVFASYVQHLVPSLSEAGVWSIKVTVLLFALGLNAFGIQAVGTVAIVFSLIVQTPFILMPITAAAYGKSFDWSAIRTSSPDLVPQLSLFISILCWNAQGWTNIGNLASEVKDPKRSFPLGAALACTLVMLNYVYPVLITFALSPDVELWQTGYFASIGQDIRPWVGIWTTVAAAVSSLNCLQPLLGLLSRAVRFTSLYRMIPVPVLRRNWKRFNTPLPALCVVGLVVGVLMSLSFTLLVTISVLFYNISLALQFAAFLRLRYTQPDAPRPYKVPGGFLGAWTVTLAFYSVLCVAFYTAAAQAPVIFGVMVCLNVVFVAASFFWVRWGYCSEVIDLVDENETAGVDASEGEAARTILSTLKSARRAAPIGIKSNKAAGPYAMLAEVTSSTG